MHDTEVSSKSADPNVLQVREGEHLSGACFVKEVMFMSFSKRPTFCFAFKFG